MARILVIEDNQTNLELMTYLLTAFGHTVLSATDGEAGVEMVRREMPDLIVCDVQLPKLDGYGVVRQLKSHPSLRSIPLVAVTALAMVGDRDKLLVAGFDGYIPKPITPETFVRDVEKFVCTGGPAAAPSMHPAAHQPSRRPRILVVDNASVNLSLAESIFEPLGYELLIANDVREALDLARQQRPDLILSDVHMPGQDGFEFIRAAKADAELRGIPFLFISSTVWQKKDEATAYELGATAFIMRPIDPQELLAVVQKYAPQSADRGPGTGGGGPTT